MKKKKNEDFAKALKAIDESNLFKTGKVLEKEYDGYIAQMGASIINSGLLPTLSFYTDIHKKEKDEKKEEKEPRRYKLLKTLFKVVDAKNANNRDKGLLDYALAKVYPQSRPNAPVGTMGNLDKQALRKLKIRVLEAAVAVKLAMRNFEQSDSTISNNQKRQG